MLRLSIATITTALIAFSAAPAGAVLLDFNFTTEQGSTGSFTLDTDSASSSTYTAPLIFAEDTGGISYPNAVSDFSFSSTSNTVKLSSETADYTVFPTLNGRREVNSLVSYESSLAPTDNPELGSTILVGVLLPYTGDTPNLSDDPSSYTRGIDNAYIDYLPGGDIIYREQITVLGVSAQPVPEPSSVLGVLAFGILGAGLLRNRTNNS